MSDNNIFGNPEDQQKQETNVAQDTQHAAPQEAVKSPETSSPNSLFADQLSQIRTDDGRQKYADVPTALASIPHAQDHIKSLTERMKQLENELAQRQGLEEVLQRIEQKQASGNVPAQPAASTFDVADIDELIEQKLSLKEQHQLAQRNGEMVKKELSERYGEKAKEMFSKKAEELGVDTGFLSDLARKSPKAVMAYFNEKPSSSNPSFGNVNSAALQQKPKSKQDLTARFFSGENESVKKWQQAKLEE